MKGFIKPTFDPSNFRPVGHIFFMLTGRAFGLDFPPWMTPVFAIHLVNTALLFILLRKLAIGRAAALAGVAFFALGAGAMDAYWKPMYVFDLLCTTFCLASLALYAYRQTALSLLAFWCAYKAKELAVMLPAALVAYEFWFGNRRFLKLIPFLAISLSFGVQGILFNPNKDNEYTFRFTLHALTQTVPFYARRFLFFRGSGLALVPLVFIRDRRVWFGLTALACFLFTLLFLPGRLFEAYAYLPLACVSIALAAAATHLKPIWIAAVFALWLPLDIRQLRREQKIVLRQGDQAFAFVDAIDTWSRAHPDVTRLVYDGTPPGFHHWGVTAAWNIVHRTSNVSAVYREGLQDVPDTAALAHWEERANKLTIHINSPVHINSPKP